MGILLHSKYRWSFSSYHHSLVIQNLSSYQYEHSDNLRFWSLRKMKGHERIKWICTDWSKPSISYTESIQTNYTYIWTIHGNSLLTKCRTLHQFRNEIPLLITQGIPESFIKWRYKLWESIGNFGITRIADPKSPVFEHICERSGRLINNLIEFYRI